MERVSLEENLTKAVAEACGASAFLVEKLSESHVFYVPGVGTYTKRSLCDFLSRDGAVPEWVNVYVANVTMEGTIFCVAYSDVFTGVDEELSGIKDGHPPFNVLMPSAPRELHEQFITEYGAGATSEAYHSYLASHPFSIKDSPSHQVMLEE